MSSSWDKVKGKDSEAEKSTRQIKAEEESLARCARRLHEILEEEGEIGKLFDEEAKQVNLSLSGDEALKACLDSMSRLRVPGFYAYRYAEEGIILIKLIAAKAAYLKMTYEKLGITSESLRLDKILNFVDEQQDIFTSTLEQMSHYEPLDATKVLEAYLKKTYGKKG